MDRQDLNTLRSIDELSAYQRSVRSRISELHVTHAGLPFPDEARTEFAELTEINKEIEARLTELRARERYIASMATQERAVESPQSAGFSSPSWRTSRNEADIYDLSSIRMDWSNPERTALEFRDRALRAVEITSFPLADQRMYGGFSTDDVRSHVEKLLRNKDDAEGHIARRILTTGNPLYRAAFGKSLLNKPLSSEEQRALDVGTGSAGGFAVPYQLDPTIIPTSNLSVNPFRAISRVDTIPGNEWRGVTSSGVTASYAAEATEASDNSPTLAQPSMLMVRAQCFVPAAIEITQDWGALLSELAALIQDAKDDIEATKFTSGNGTNEPFGLLTGATTTVTAGGSGAFAVADLYKTEEALGPRFRPRASWVANRFTYNKTRQFDTSGGASLWTQYPAPLQVGLANGAPRMANIGIPLIGYPAYEDSAMVAALTTGSKIATLGDFRYYLIVDRVGMDMELIPHLFGPSNRYPTGQRGYYAYWRNNGKVLDANAFRVLVTG